MANKVFISFRFSDGNKYKKELEELFSDVDDVINCSEDKDRSNMTDETIKKYLYEKLKNTSVTIVLLTPHSISHQKLRNGKYDDWMYDEIRYSLEDREWNRCNGLIAVYVPDAEQSIRSASTCTKCGQNCKTSVIYNFDNLVRKNMMNVRDDYKKNPCDGIYDLTDDSYCTLVSLEEFKKHYADYIQNADKKRHETYKYDIRKDLNK